MQELCRIKFQKAVPVKNRKDKTGGCLCAMRKKFMG